MSLWNYPKRARQLANYEGLEIEGCTPTDIDCFFEWRNLAYIIVELKTFDTPLPYGQELALKRMANDFQRSGKEAIVIVGEHYEDAEQDIRVRDCIVRWVYYNGKQYEAVERETLKYRMETFIDYVERKKVKA